ncbi:MAG: type II toxin-antitoxin system RelE/ParE family toxin [Acidobacteria bacterium]|nr:type II toxin-antitoxin system RelE/ParE family toxin [Acidobacteriota bacterium]
MLVNVLMHKGPSLGRPQADTIKGSVFSNMKELRVQSAGHPLRIFFAFDPRRMAILLIGGDKTGNKRFYEQMIPLADEIYRRHLIEIGIDPHRVMEVDHGEKI